MFMVAKGLRALVPVPVKHTLRRTVAWIRIPQARLRLAFGVTPLNAPWVHRRGGLQVHRYYVEAFLGEFAADIHGHCLEFQDGHYATRFGGKQVTKLDILHKEEGNPRATLVADLTQPHAIPEQSSSELPLPQCGIKPAHSGCTRLKSHHGGQRQDASLQRLRTKAFTSAELHRFRESASLRTRVNNVLTRFASQVMGVGYGHMPGVGCVIHE
jgi:hypothetical protein